MALSDYDITFSFPEISSIAEDRENSTYDDHADDGDSYILSAPSSPGSERLVPIMSVNKLMKHTLESNVQEDYECSGTASHPSFGQKRKPQRKKQNEHNGKNISRKRTKGGHKNYVQSKTNLKAQTPSKRKRSPIENSRSEVSKKSRIKREHENLDAESKLFVDAESKLFVDAESKLFVPALKPSKCQTQGSIKTKTNSDLFAAPVTSVTAANTTTTLLSMIALAVSSPQYTSSHMCVSSTASDYSACPTRNSWPLLREMIAKPAGTVVSISPAPRQSLSTVKVEAANGEEPKARVASKLEKEIKCECKFNKGEPCWFLFQEDQLRKERLHHLTLKRESLDLVILAKIAANINREEKTKKCHGRDRQRCRVCYYHEGRQICRETFMFIHGICKGRLCALMQHYKKKGLSTRTHGNKANIPHHALSDKDNERVLDFIQDYANSHCLSTFGRKPGSKARGGGLLIMSTAQSKLYVHHKYKLWCYENKHRAVSLRSFQNLWTKHLPYIVVLRGSNKTPVPDPELHPKVLDLPEDIDFVDETGAEVKIEKTSHLHSRRRSMITDDTLKEVEVQADGVSKQGHCDSSTQADIDCVKEGKLNRKRKSLPPRKVDLVSCLPEDTDGEFEHNQIFSQPHIMHPFISSNDNDIHLDGPDSVIDNSNEVDVIQDPLPQIDLQNSFFNGEQHVPQTSSSASLLSHRPVVMNFGHQQAAVILPAEKDICTFGNKSPTPVTKTSLHAPLGLSQPSELLDTYSMQCCDRFAPEVSDSHSLCDQSQSVFLSHQGLDLSNIHQLEWQTWPSYSSL